MYPIVDIDTKFGGLSFLFARLCGVLSVCGNYIKDSIFLTQRMPVGYDAAGNIYTGGGYYPHYSPPARPDYLYDERWSREKKQETRDIGDRLDRG
jgi:hypothetical protein